MIYKLILNYLILGLLLVSCTNKQSSSITYPEDQGTTYCNPIDLDYSFMTHRTFYGVSYRSGADPAVVFYHGKYYLFSTRSHGYWSSIDLKNWKFIKPTNWYHKGSNAPSVAIYKDQLIVLADPSGRNAMLISDDPDSGVWNTSYCEIPIAIQDPALFVDDDNRVYLYEESSNKWPIRGVELDPENCFLPIGEETDLLYLNPEVNGWERFGQDHTSEIKPFIEGPWMTKKGDTYYLEYGAPGTQWNVYGDGVYTSKSPLGPFTYAHYNPVSYKPGGYVTGAGHGSTMNDANGQLWHFGTSVISVNFLFERRLSMYPGKHFEDGQLYVHTAYADYPQWNPSELKSPQERFRGWMLLSYNKPVSTSVPGTDFKMNTVKEAANEYKLKNIVELNNPQFITDENIRTTWATEQSKSTEPIEITIDLEKTAAVKALQINFQEVNGEIFEPKPTIAQQYQFMSSIDGKNWELIIDFSQSKMDRPNAYIELKKPVNARYIKYVNVDFYNEMLAISDIRIFGNSSEPLPKTVANFIVKRMEDRRDMELSWDKLDNVLGYTIYWGISKDRLTNSYQLYNVNTHSIRALSTNQSYYVKIEAYNENGIGESSEILYIE